MDTTEKLYNVFITNYRTDTVFVTFAGDKPEELTEYEAVELIKRLTDNKLTIIGVMNSATMSEGLIVVADHNRDHLDFVATAVPKE